MARRPNQSSLKEISPEYSLEGLMLRLKLQYFGHLMRRASSLEETLMLGKIEGRRSRGSRGWVGWKASPTQWTWDWAHYWRKWRTGKSGVPMGSQRVWHNCLTDRQCMRDYRGRSGSTACTVCVSLLCFQKKSSLKRDNNMIIPNFQKRINCQNCVISGIMCCEIVLEW